MRFRTLTAGALAVLALAGASAATAAADTTLVTDPSAQNVTAYGSTAAWSRKAPDGSYRLVIRSGGTVADAPVPAASTPYDPDLGPTSDNKRVVVYARGGDLYRYEVGAAAEAKIAKLSSSSAKESAPSFFKENIAFGRSGGKRPGMYLYRAATGKTVRLAGSVPRETDVGSTRVVGRFGSGSGSTIRRFNHTGSDHTTIAGARSGERVLSPTLTRFNVVWLRVRKSGSYVQEVGVNAHRGLKTVTATRKLEGTATSLATFGIPRYYTNAVGVIKIDPKLRFYTFKS